MISLKEAKAKTLEGVTPLGAEECAVGLSVGRVLAQALTAKRTQPPHDLSAMDGYAVKASEALSFKVIGESAAGHPFAGSVNRGEAVRIFTGAAVPMGADSIIMQEDVTREGDCIALKSLKPQQHIRAKGIDFKAGESFFTQGEIIKTTQLGLIAALNYRTIQVYRAPRVAILSTGDELVEAGEAVNENHIVSTNALVLAQLCRENGAMVQDFGICEDRPASLSQKISEIRAGNFDLLITSGGASVGDYDLVQQTLGAAGMALSFWKIAMRPGKPLIHGQLGTMKILGLPGNPVSSFVCGHQFVVPLLKAMQGRKDLETPYKSAPLRTALKVNDQRAEFLRGRFVEGQIEVFTHQDSSLLSVLSLANVLVFREAFDKSREIGENVFFIKI